MSHPNFSASSIALLSIVPASVVFISAFAATRTSRPRTPRGCRRLGIASASNIADEYDYDEQGQRKKHSVKPGPTAKEDDGFEIKALFSYPLKSCAGVELDVADVNATGLQYDRQFCFAEYITPSGTASESKEDDREPKGRWDCRTLRDGKFSKMVLIRPEVWIPDPASPTYSPVVPEVRSQGVLVIRYPRVRRSPITRLLMTLRVIPREESFQVPLEPPADNDDDDDERTHPHLPVRIFKSCPTAISYASLIPPSLSTFLEASRPLTLFRSLPTHRRPVRGNGAALEPRLGFSPTNAFQDEYPLQMQNLGSIRAMEERVGTAAIPRLSVRRFRPNVVVSGCKAFEEDTWTKVRFVPTSAAAKANSPSDDDEGTVVHVCCRTVRCRLPNVDPDTGIRHSVEPDRTLRRTRAIDRGAPSGGCLGMMMVPAVTDFTIRVGDRLEVLETGEHFYRKE